MLVRSVCGATLAQSFDHYKECTDDEDGLHRAWLEGNRPFTRAKYVAQVEVVHGSAKYVPSMHAWIDQRAW